MKTLQQLGLVLLMSLSVMLLVTVGMRTYQYNHDRHDQLDRIERMLEAQRK